MARVLEQAGVNDNGTKNLINFCSAIWGLVNSMFLAFFMHRFKRRSAFLVCEGRSYAHNEVLMQSLPRPAQSASWL